MAVRILGARGSTRGGVRVCSQRSLPKATYHFLYLQLELFVLQHVHLCQVAQVLIAHALHNPQSVPKVCQTMHITTLKAMSATPRSCNATQPHAGHQLGPSLASILSCSPTMEVKQENTRKYHKAQHSSNTHAVEGPSQPGRGR